MKKVHFIGIGGIGVSAIAQIYQEQSLEISGSDMQESQITKNLKEKGIKISIGHKAQNIQNQDLIIYSPAIPDTNIEILTAKKLKIKTISYPEALGELSKKYFTIAISGTHGKSTTTAMTALALTKAGLDPTVIIGTKIKEFSSQNYRLGKSKYLILEACEYKESFKHLHPQILVITNIEAEHLDYYKTEKNYIQAFKNFCNTLPKESTIIIDQKDKNSIQATKESPAKIKSWKLNKNLKIGIPGEHNQKNAQNTITIAQILKIDPKIITQSLSQFKGSWRRMEYIGQKGKTHFYDDYAHHPTEIKATLKAFRQQYGTKAKILTVFQPHQYSRTHELLTQFAESFAETDQVIIPNIYRVRDTAADLAKVSPDHLVKLIGKKASNGRGLENTKKYLEKNYKNFDLIITMGAGNISSALNQK